ncbi:MAG: methyltransferase, partial [Candidatus Cloacimonetes bacterium]|nr:methyltransferase [Candidatus Cloacimonadota bacterium]
MSQTPKEVVKRCLTFIYPERIPRDMWLLPWAEHNFPQTVKEITERFPSDFTGTDYCYDPSSKVKGDPYKKGYYTDEWGCVFKNIREGIIGEVEIPLVQDISDWDKVEPPNEQLPSNPQKAYDIIKRSYERTDKFVKANICPRPWERYQFIRGTENALIDVLMPDYGFKDLLKRIHEFYLKEMEFWVKAEVDAIMFMDDWGAQNRLLINPEAWREFFKPLYKDYCDLAKSSGKFVFMHSDGFIQDIYPDLIEIGVDALNSQLFCMDMKELSRTAKGKISFWGEIDRQHILPSKNPEEGRDAVRKVAQHLYDFTGGIIAQFEFGIGANPDTAMVIFEEW